MELFPSDYPGLYPELPTQDWRGYKEFSFDIYNPSAQSVPLGIRIDDKKDFPDYPDRFNKRFDLAPGPNHIVIPLAEMVTSGSGRHLDVSTIFRFMVFVPHPKTKVTLFADYLHLTR